jgi:hypothetical protein
MCLPYKKHDTAKRKCPKCKGTREEIYLHYLLGEQVGNCTRCDGKGWVWF